jgi:hypothetical protein
LINDHEGEYLPVSLPFTVDAHCSFIFGTDFPNLPYAWDREIRILIGLKLPDPVLEGILGKNAVEFYCI